MKFARETCSIARILEAKYVCIGFPASRSGHLILDSTFMAGGGCSVHGPQHGRHPARPETPFGLVEVEKGAIRSRPLEQIDPVRSCESRLQDALFYKNVAKRECLNARSRCRGRGTKFLKQDGLRFGQTGIAVSAKIQEDIRASGVTAMNIRCQAEGPVRRIYPGVRKRVLGGSGCAARR